jgi:hypothetical protein
METNGFMLMRILLVLMVAVVAVGPLAAATAVAVIYQ